MTGRGKTTALAQQEEAADKFTKEKKKRQPLQILFELLIQRHRPEIIECEGKDCCCIGKAANHGEKHT